MEQLISPGYSVGEILVLTLCLLPDSPKAPIMLSLIAKLVLISSLGSSLSHLHPVFRLTLWHYCQRDSCPKDNTDSISSWLGPPRLHLWVHSSCLNNSLSFASQHRVSELWIMAWGPAQPPWSLQQANMHWLSYDCTKELSSPISLPGSWWRHVLCNLHPVWGSEVLWGAYRLPEIWRERSRAKVLP